MHEVLVNRLGGLSLPRKSVVRLTDRPNMTLDVYRGRKTIKQSLKGYCTVFQHAFKSLKITASVLSERMSKIARINTKELKSYEEFKFQLA